MGMQGIYDVLLYCAVLLSISGLSFPFLKRRSEQYLSGQSARNAEPEIPQLRIDTLALLLAYAISIVFICFRINDPSLGVLDANFYQQYFEDIPPSLPYYLTEVTTFEIGYSIATWVVRQITSQYWVMLFIWDTLIFICLTRFLSRINLSSNGFFVVLLIEATLFDQLLTLRMAISIAIALNAFVEISLNRWGRALLLLLIAASMHISALLLLPAYVIIYIYLHSNKQPFFWLILLVCGGVAIAAFSLTLIYRVVSGSAKAVYFAESSLSLGVYLTMLVFSILTFRRFWSIASDAPINIILMTLIPTCFLCVPLQLLASAFYRCLLFYIPIVLALIPSIIKSYRKSPITVTYAIVWLICYGYISLRIYSFIVSQIPNFGIYANWLLQ